MLCIIYLPPSPRIAHQLQRPPPGRRNIIWINAALHCRRRWHSAPPPPADIAVGIVALTPPADDAIVPPHQPPDGGLGWWGGRRRGQQPIPNCADVLPRHGCCCHHLIRHRLHCCLHCRLCQRRCQSMTFALLAAQQQ